MTWADELAAFAASRLGPRERDELYGRGVSDEQMELFQIGYLNGRLPPLSGAEDFLEWALHGDKLVDVFVFPMTTPSGVIGGFQFRYVDREKKGYTDFFVVHDEPCFFGLAQAMPHIWETGGVWLVEGVFDLLPLQRHIGAIFPTMTAKVTAPVGRFLRRFVRRVWVGYDMDGRGRKAASEVVREYGRQIEVVVVSYPKLHKLGSQDYIKDPGDLWEIWGDAKLGEFLRNFAV